MRSVRLAAAVSLSILSVLLTALLPVVGAADAPVPIGPGAIYQRMYRPEVPWTIHVVEADLSEDFLEVRALLGGGEKMARKRLSGILAVAQSDVVRPVAAVNADFFSLAGGSYEGVPLGLHVSQGELVTFPDPARSVFYILDDGSAHIDRLRPNVWLWGPQELLYPVAAMNRPPGFSDVVLFTPRFGEQTRANAETTQIALVGLTGPFRVNARISARIASVTVGASQRIPPEGAVLAARGVGAYALRNLKAGDEIELSLTLEGEEGTIREAVGGGPRLVRNGAASVEHQRERFSNGFAGKRHPRSGLGVRDGTVVMVAVDGRQPGYSEGMTLYELADLFIELGCTDAMNLDGGGSATMVVRDRVMNFPSGGAERAVVNGLGLFCSAPLGPPVQLAVEPRVMTVLCGERVALKPRGVDQYYNPVPVDPEKVAWE
ncbi:MAG: phosphodiester glycosidase family protein, partial [Armatimonadetes bacterium]|nr:phosphodiester glycosidase family protein [Armatimonadota bacterium]